MLSSVHWLVNRDDRGVSFVIAVWARAVAAGPGKLELSALISRDRASAGYALRVPG